MKRCRRPREEVLHELLMIFTVNVKSTFNNAGGGFVWASQRSASRVRLVRLPCFSQILIRARDPMQEVFTSIVWHIRGQEAQQADVECGWT